MLTTAHKRRAPSLPSTGSNDFLWCNVAETGVGTSGTSIGDTEYNLNVILMDGRHVTMVVDSK